MPVNPQLGVGGVGRVAANLHEGSRSEILADYLFSAWGTVTPCRRQDDHGVDLYCTLTKRIGQLAQVEEYFVVQVKSNNSPWEFRDADSVRWLIDYPTPIFLAWVDKKTTTVNLYHLFPRFLAAAAPSFQQLILVPGIEDEGHHVEWKSGDEYDLGAPILRVTMSDQMDGDKMGQLRSVLADWVRLDRENAELKRRGLTRFRMPISYSVNQSPSQSGHLEFGFAQPAMNRILEGLPGALEAIECLSGQLARHGDGTVALLAMLLLNHAKVRYPNAFERSKRWLTPNRFNGDLEFRFLHRLNDATGGEVPHLYSEIERITTFLVEDPTVRAFLKSVEHEEQTRLGGTIDGIG